MQLQPVLSPQIDSVNSFGCTPLHVACNNGQDVVVNVLLQHSAVLNPLNNKGQVSSVLCIQLCFVQYCGHLLFIFFYI